MNQSHPLIAPHNPGQGVSLKLVTTSGEEQLVRLSDLLESVLLNMNFAVANEGLCLRIVGTDFIVTPLAVDLMQSDQRFQTTTTIQVDSPLGLKQTVFEFQHDSGDQPLQALTSGFKKWVEYELSVLLDVIEPDPTTSAGVAFSWQEPHSQTRTVRKVTFGPIEWVRIQPDITVFEPTGHLFCRCCMFRNRLISDTLGRFLKSNELHAIKLFAFRDADGKTSADCRVNGVNFEDGKNALLQYARTWPGRHMETRKQYITFHTVGSGLLSENWQKL